MFKQKKKLEQLANKLQNLECMIQEQRYLIDALMRAHLNEPNAYECRISATKTVYIPRFFHANPTAPSALTRECGEVSFKELARYVIDKEPIAREVTSIKYFDHPDNRQGTVEETNDGLNNT